MMKLKDTMDAAEFKKFVEESFFTIKRTDTFFTGTWTDQVVEQDVMRPIKVSGGLQSGKNYFILFLNCQGLHILKWIKL